MGKLNTTWQKVILAFCNQKGGVAKSTMAIHAAHYAVDFLKLRVVFVDMDTQRNGTSCFPDAPQVMDASELFDLCPDDWVAPAWEGGPGLRLIPANEAVKGVESHVASLMAGDGDLVSRPRAWLSRLDCDLVIIDTPPTAMVRLCSALVASDCVVTPFTMQSFSLDGIAGLYQTIQNMKAYHNPGLRYLGILPSKINSRSSSQKQAFEELREQLGDMLIPVKVMERAPIGEAMDFRRPVWAKANGESARAAADEVKAACKEIFKRAQQ